MNADLTCPVCGRVLKSPNFRHIYVHGMTMLQWHSLRIETQIGLPISAILTTLVYVEMLGSEDICRKLKLTFRTFRGLMVENGIPMRTRGDSVRIQWLHDDGKRSEQASERMRQTVSKQNLQGSNNPAKREDVRRKISDAKRSKNPGLIAMLRACRNMRTEGVPTSIEKAMAEALSRRGIPFEREYPVGRYSLDLAIPSYKIDVECDGRGWHYRPKQIEHDTRRDDLLAKQGWLVFRYSQDRIEYGADDCVSDLLSRLNVLGIDPTTR